MKHFLVSPLLLTLSVPLLLLTACHTAGHVAHETGDAAGHVVRGTGRAARHVVHGTGRVVQKAGTKVEHVGERIAD
jgi:hypothetical protein